VLNTLIGAACGPLLIASVTERFMHDPALVGWSIAMVVIPCLAAGSALYALARRAIRRGTIAQDSECAALLAGETGLAGETA